MILIITQGKDWQAMSRLKKKNHTYRNRKWMSTYPGLGRGWAVRGSVGGFRAGWGVAANGYKGFFFFLGEANGNVCK